MIKYRLLCFWATTAVAASSIGLAQPPPAQPAATPAETSAASAVSRGLKPAVPAKTKSKQSAATSVKKTSTKLQTNPTVGGESPAQIAIVELPPGSKSEVIRKVVELLEKQGIAKQVPSGIPTKTMRADLSARIAATPDVKTEDAIALVKSLQGHGIVRLSFVKPTDNRNVVTVLAPADTPWPVIDNIRIMVTAMKRFSVDVQIATPAQAPETVRGGSFNPRGTSRYGYSARPGDKASATNQSGSSTSKTGRSRYYASSTQPAASNTTIEKKQQPEQVTQIFRLKYADADVLSKSVAQLFDKSFGIVPDVRTNSVIVRGAPSQLREMEALVKMLDSQQPQRPMAQVFRPGNTDGALRQVIKPLNSIFESADLPAATPVPNRAQIDQLDRSARAAAETLRSLKAAEAAEESEVPEDEDKRKAVLRDAVRQTFLARQNLQRKELAEFAARLNRIRQTIEIRDKIADKIIDRRVEELLDPNLKWDADTTVGAQKTVVRNQSAIKQQNQVQRFQPASNQYAATRGQKPVVVARPSDGTLKLKMADESFFTTVAIDGNCPAIGPPETIAVLRSLEFQRGLKAGTLSSIHEANESSVRVVVEPVYQKLLSVRNYPTIGPASLHLLRHRCTVDFKKTPGVEWPLKKDGVPELNTTFYMDSDHLHPWDSEGNDR